MRSIRLMVLGATLCAASAFADTLTLTSYGNTLLEGATTGPYTATINGVTGIPVICDDFSTYSTIGKTVTVKETKASDLVGPTANTVVKFYRDDVGLQQGTYLLASYLAVQLVSVDQSTAAGRYQGGLLNYAIWGLFTPTVLNNVTLGLQASVISLLSEAYVAISAASLTLADFSHVSFWTPQPNGASQEFISVRRVSTPESSAMLLLGFCMVGTFAAIWRYKAHIVVRN